MKNIYSCLIGVIKLCNAIAVILMITCTVCPIRVQASGKSKPALILVSKGKPNATIVISSVKSRTIEFAVRELNGHIEKITGTKLPVVTDGQAITGQRVLVGKSAATDALRLNAADFIDQEYLVSSSPGTLILMGKDDPDSRMSSRTESVDDFWAFDSKSPDSKDIVHLPDLFSNNGTLYAVYDFLENDCGVRWYAPGKLGVVADKQVNITIETGERRRSPVMTYREVNPTKSKASSLVNPAVAPYPSFTAHEKTLWLLRMRAGGENVMRGNHSFYGFYDRFSKQYGKNTGRFESDHPEFFAKELPHCTWHLSLGLHRSRSCEEGRPDLRWGKPVPLDLMELQCSLGLKWLKEGRVSDIVILGNSHLDIGINTAPWMREWIKKHGDEKLN